MSEQTINLITFGLYGKKSATRRTGSLRKGHVEVFKGLGGKTVRCTSGSLWVTIEGDTKDYLLNQNETVAIPNLGKVLLSGSGSYQI
jgi:hypothetical protein